MKKNNIVWGILFLVAAALIIVSKLGLINGISIFTILCTVLFVGTLLHGLVRMEFTSILFSLAFLGILYDKQLGIEALTPWTVLGAALLGSVGLNLIFHRHHNHSSYRQYHKHTGRWNHQEEGNPHDTDSEFDRIINEPDTEAITCEANFGGTVKYVNTDCFEKADIDCSFGAVKMYFDNATLKGNTAVVHVDCNFGGVELFFPHTWNVICDVATSFAGIEEKNKPVVSQDAPMVRVVGDLSFAGLTIWYV